MQSILIRSKDRHTSSASSAAAKYLLTPGLSLGDEKKGIRRLKLEYVQVFNTPYNIQTDVNDRLDYDEYGIAWTAIIPAGYYSASSLATAIGTAMTATSSSNYTVTYSTVTRKLSFSADISFSLRCLTGENKAYSPWKELGFSAASGLTAVDTDGGYDCVAPYPVNLALPLSWHVQIPELGQPLQTTDGKKYRLYLPMTAGTGGIMEYTGMMPTQELTTEEGLLRNFSVTWVANGSVLSLLNSEWEIMFSIH